MQPTDTFAPGEVCPRSGIYEATASPSAASWLAIAQIALSRGDRFPPIPGKGRRWQLVTPTEDRQADAALD
jgi:hypothetical protein